MQIGIKFKFQALTHIQAELFLPKSKTRLLRVLFNFKLTGYSLNPKLYICSIQYNAVFEKFYHLTKYHGLQLFFLSFDYK
jgi:hypothetical protein